MKPHETLSEIEPSVKKWVASVLRDKGFSSDFHLDVVREMAWSLVAKVTYDRGVWYFKYLPAYFAHELPLTKFLSELESDFVGGFIAMDTAQRFLLVDDAGPMLRDRFETDLDASLWLDSLTRYAELQIQLMNNTRVGGLELPNRSLSALPDLVLPHLDWAMSLNGDDESDQFRDEHRKILNASFERWDENISELYAFGLTDCLNHGDFHDGNIAYRDKPVLFDWGDASLSHPFTCMRTVLVSVTNRFGFAEDDKAAVEPFIEAYLKPWTAYANYSDLRALFTRIQKVWALVTFLSWKQGLTNMSDERGKQYHYALPALLREYVDAQN